MKKIELNIIALANSESSEGNYALILEEYNGYRRLPIIIGAFEAQAIAIALENVAIDRPLTHDLFKKTLEAAGVSITEVIIDKFIDGVFQANLIGITADAKPLTVDARSSDAIALAVRFACPIYTTEDILNEAGIALDDPNKAFTNQKGSLSEYSLEELELFLKQVIAKEDYKSAAKIRDLINKKKGN